MKGRELRRRSRNGKDRSRFARFLRMMCSSMICELIDATNGCLFQRDACAVPPSAYRQLGVVAHDSYSTHGVITAWCATRRETERTARALVGMDINNVTSALDLAGAANQKWRRLFVFNPAENVTTPLKNVHTTQQALDSGHHSAKPRITQRSVHGGGGTVHASCCRTFQERLRESFGCCAAQHALPAAQARRADAASQGQREHLGPGQ